MKKKNKKENISIVKVLLCVFILFVLLAVILHFVSIARNKARIQANITKVTEYAEKAKDMCKSLEIESDMVYSYDISEIQTDSNYSGYYQLDSSCNVKIAMKNDDENDYCYSKEEGSDASYYELKAGKTCLIKETKVTDDDCFTYSEDGGKITITGYRCGGSAEEIDGLSEDKIVSGSISINKYVKGKEMNVVIPGEINGMPVTKIGSFAFSIVGEKKNDDLIVDELKNVLVSSVVIPSSVEEIDDYAFSINVIDNVTISSGVKKIGDSAFAYNRLNELNIPDSVESIGKETFGVNLSMNRVRLSNNLKEIPANAFILCSLRKELVIPDSVSSIGEEAFYGNNISKVVIGKNVGSIGKGAFYIYENYESNSNLTQIVNNSNNIFNWENILFSDDKAGSKKETGLIKYNSFEVNITK